MATNLPTVIFHLIGEYLQPIELLLFFNTCKKFKPMKKEVVHYHLNLDNTVKFLKIEKFRKALSKRMLNSSHQLSLTFSSPKDRHLQQACNFTQFKSIRINKGNTLTTLNFIPPLKSFSLCDNDTISDVSVMGHLYELELKKMPRLVDVSGLQAVHTLNLSACYSLTDISPLRNVHTLILADCYRIVDFSSLGNHYLLDLTQTKYDGSTHLEEGLHHLGNVHTLILRKCRSIRSLKNLRNVKRLDLSWCSEMAELRGIEQVRKLDISHCRLLPTEEFKALSVPFLRELIIDGVTSRAIEAEEAWLSLKVLKMTNHPLPRRQVPTLPAGIRTLAIGGLDGMEHFDQLLPDLDTVTIDHFPNLQSLEGLKAVRQLKLNLCNRVNSLPNFAEGGRLDSLHISKCQALEVDSLSLPPLTIRRLRLDCVRSFPRLFHSWTLLQRISIFSKLTEEDRLVIDFGEFKRLEALELGFSESGYVPLITGLDKLRELRYVHLENTMTDSFPKALCHDPSEGLPTQFDGVRLENTSRPLVDRYFSDKGPTYYIRNLHYLHLINCDIITRLNHIAHIKSIYIDKCDQLTSITHFQKVEKLHVVDCANITEISHGYSVGNLICCQLPALEVVVDLQKVAKAMFVQCTKLSDQQSVRNQCGVVAFYQQRVLGSRTQTYQGGLLDWDINV